MSHFDIESLSNQVIKSLSDRVVESSSHLVCEMETLSLKQFNHENPSSSSIVLENFQHGLKKKKEVEIPFLNRRFPAEATVKTSISIVCNLFTPVQWSPLDMTHHGPITVISNGLSL